MDRAGAAAIPSAARVQRGPASATQADQGPGPSAPAADRHRGQAPPVRGGRAVHRRRRGLGRPRAPRPGLAGPGVAALAWSRSGTRPNGSPVSAPHPPSPADRATSVIAIGTLLGRCTFPDPAPRCCGVSGGADSLALLVLAVAAGCRGDRRPRRPRAAAGSAAEADVVAAAADVSAPLPVRTGDGGGGPNLEARARAARLAVLGPRRPPATRPTIRPRP